MEGGKESHVAPEPRVADPWLRGTPAASLGAWRRLLEDTAIKTFTDKASSLLWSFWCKILPKTFRLF